VVGFEGELVFDATKPDGTPRKLLDVSKLAAMGWRASIPLEEGIRATYEDFLAREATPAPRAVAA
jgi:GDP-L-fucose synthase